MKRLLPYEAALDRIVEHRRSGDVVAVSLENASGAILAEDVTARVTQPPLSVSAMDGYAVQFDDVRSGNATLRVVGEAPAGRPSGIAISRGETVRIFTGGAVPEGADHIVIQEHTERSGDTVRVEAPEQGPRFIRPAGMDFRAGDTLLRAGQRLAPAHLAALAAANHSSVQIRKRPSVALLANGDELRPPGTDDLAAGQVIAASGFGIAALIETWGGDVLDLGIAADDPGDIRARLMQGREADIVVPIGGASVGDHDHMQGVIADLGYETVFSRIAVRPGKPTWFAKQGNQCVLGLPGNPASSLVCAHLFLHPLITGQRPQFSHAKSVDALPKNGPREAFLRCKVTTNEDGRLEARLHDNQDSSLITPFLSCNALLRRPPNAAPLSAGETVPVLMI